MMERFERFLELPDGTLHPYNYNEVNMEYKSKFNFYITYFSYFISDLTAALPLEVSAKVILNFEHGSMYAIDSNGQRHDYSYSQ